MTRTHQFSVRDATPAIDNSKRFLKWTVLFFALSCSGCATPVHIDSTNLHQTTVDFMNGDLNLSDSIITYSGSFRVNRDKMHAYYVAENWVALTKLVMEVNSDNDLAWFYLGRSAEAFGYRTAAQRYYSRALSSVMKCESGILTGNTCGGLDFPHDIEARLAALNASAN